MILHRGSSIHMMILHRDSSIHMMMILVWVSIWWYYIGVQVSIWYDKWYIRVCVSIWWWLKPAMWVKHKMNNLLWWTCSRTSFSKHLGNWEASCSITVFSDLHASSWVKLVWPVARQVQIFWEYRSFLFLYSLAAVLKKIFVDSNVVTQAYLTRSLWT